MLLIWTTGISKIFVMTVEVQFCPLIWLFSWWRWHLQDLSIKPKYLVTFTVGSDQKDNIDAAVKKVISVSALHQSVLWLVFTHWQHSAHSSSKLLSVASYGGELLLDSSSPWSGVSSLSSFSIPLPFIFQEVKESIDEEDPRPTSSNGACIMWYQSIFI